MIPFLIWWYAKYHEYQQEGVMPLIRNLLDFSMFNEICQCCLQQYSIIEQPIALWITWDVWRFQWNPFGLWLNSMRRWHWRVIHWWWKCKFVQLLCNSTWWLIGKLGIDLPHLQIYLQLYQSCARTILPRRCLLMYVHCCSSHDSRELENSLDVHQLMSG